MSNLEIQKADVAVAIQRARGAVEVVVFFESDGNLEQTCILPEETVVGAFANTPEVFEKFVRIESDAADWASLANSLRFEN